MQTSIDNFEHTFPKAICLMTSEVRVILEKQRETMIASHRAINPYYEASLEYAQTFDRFASAPAVKEVRRLLDSREDLTRIDIALVGSLCPVTPEEAKAIVPQLEFGQLDDESLETLLEEMNRFRSTRDVIARQTS